MAEGGVSPGWGVSQWLGYCFPSVPQWKGGAMGGSLRVGRAWTLPGEGGKMPSVPSPPAPEC